MCLQIGKPVCFRGCSCNGVTTTRRYDIFNLRNARIRSWLSMIFASSRRVNTSHRPIRDGTPPGCCRKRQWTKIARAGRDSSGRWGRPSKVLIFLSRWNHRVVDHELRGASVRRLGALGHLPRRSANLKWPTLNHPEHNSPPRNILPKVYENLPLHAVLI